MGCFGLVWLDLVWVGMVWYGFVEALFRWVKSKLKKREGLIEKETVESLMEKSMRDL